MRSSLITALLSVVAAVSLQAQDFNWHGRLAAGKRLEVKGVNGDVRALLASGADAVVTARKHSRRSAPDEVKIEVVESADWMTTFACYRTPARARRRTTTEPSGHL